MHVLLHSHAQSAVLLLAAAAANGPVIAALIAGLVIFVFAWLRNGPDGVAAAQSAGDADAQADASDADAGSDGGGAGGGE